MAKTGAFEDVAGPSTRKYQVDNRTYHEHQQYYPQPAPSRRATTRSRRSGRSSGDSVFHERVKTRPSKLKELKIWTRRPVSRVLCRPLRDAAVIPLDRPLLDGSRDLPGQLGPARPCPGQGRGALSLFGLAPGGACHAVPVAGSAVGSYPTLSPLPSAEALGGLLSVALSLGSPPAGVTRRLFAVEPGLSSTFTLREDRDRPAI